LGGSALAAVIACFRSVTSLKAARLARPSAAGPSCLPLGQQTSGFAEPARLHPRQAELLELREEGLELRGPLEVLLLELAEETPKVFCDRSMSVELRFLLIWKVR
jgi:hypothetical protein